MVCIWFLYLSAFVSQMLIFWGINCSDIFDSHEVFIHVLLYLVASRRIFEMTGTTVGWCMTGIGITHVPAFSCATKTRSILCAPVTEQSFNCSEIRPLILNLIYSLTSGTHHVKLVTWYFHALQGLYYGM